MSIELPDTAIPGVHGNIFRNALAGPSLAGQDGVQTLYEAWKRSVKRYGNSPCIGWRPLNEKKEAGPYVWSTYGQVHEQASQFASGLVALNLVPPTPDFRCGLLGFYAKNRPEWTIGEQACNRLGIVAVPLYDTLVVDGCQYVLDQTLVSTILCTSDIATHMLQASALGAKNGKASSLKCIVLMDAKTKRDCQSVMDEAQACSKGGQPVQVLAWTDVLTAGKASPCPPRPPSARDVAFFCYTSGTTGEPKGALITQANMVSCLASVLATKLNDIVRDDGSSVHLSYLPLPHVFERVNQMIMFAYGGRVGYFQGDTLKILDDLVALRPTFFPSVPRLLTRVHDKILAGVNQAGGLKKQLFMTALNAKIANLQIDQEGKGKLSHKVWDNVVFGPLKKRLGLDRVEIILTGSAPLSVEVMTFLRAVFGCPVMEGYGQTESAAVSTLSLPDDFTVGHVGVPAPSNEIALFDVPEMGYLSTDTKHGELPCRGRGEICFRGVNVFKEYYKLPEKTAETLDSDGWLHSGDIGVWTVAGKLKIVDRKKNIFKLSQGEYVAAEKIENIYASSPLVAQSFVYGDSLQSTLVAIVVPDEEQLRLWWAKEGGATKATLAQLCADPKVIKGVFADMTRVGKEGKLKGFEEAKAIFLDHQVFSVERGLLTPTFKLKRQEARELYRPIIDDLYKQQAPKAKL